MRNGSLMKQLKPYVMDLAHYKNVDYHVYQICGAMTLKIHTKVEGLSILHETTLP